MRKNAIQRLTRLSPLLFLFVTPAFAIVGPSFEVVGPRSAVMIVGAGGTFCTGTAVTPRVVLTAGHCIQPGVIYKIVEFDKSRTPWMLDVRNVVRHPQFDFKALLSHRATADIALMFIAQPLPQQVAPAKLGKMERVPLVGETLSITGFGVALPGDEKTSGTLRKATLAVTGKPGNLQVRLHDPATRNERPGLGACTGDSGAPVFSEGYIVGVVSWSTGPNNSAGCGGLTGVTPLSLYYNWITEQIRRFE
jgi:hypothetical protein